MQTKNEVKSYDAAFSVPSVHTSVCGRDEGKYVSEVYSVVDNKKGVLLGSVTFEITSVSGTGTEPRVTITSPNGGEVLAQNCLTCTVNFLLSNIHIHYFLLPLREKVADEALA